MVKPYYILALDGGGIRGIATLAFLNKLENEMKKTHPDFKISTHFDMFSGTSVGGLMAGIFSHCQLSTEEISQKLGQKTFKTIMNKSIWDKAFGLLEMEPRYDGKGKSAVINDFFGDTLYSNVGGKDLVVVTYDLKNRNTEIFKSWDCCEKILAREVLDATSAAPIYFPTVLVKNCEGGDLWMIDGGVVCNNPTMCAVAEATKLLKDRGESDRPIVVLNVGTGYNISPIDGEKSREFGAICWIRHHLLDIIMDETYVEKQAKLFLGDNYIRVSGSLLQSSDDIDDTSEENVELLRQLGVSWWDKLGDECVCKLSNNYVFKKK